jgi:hypothetical protein
MGQTLKRGGSRISDSALSALPGRRLIPSPNPRMLTPFEVDLLRQDLQMALKLLGQDEIDDAHTLIRAQGFRPVDFEIVWHADPSPAVPGAATGNVTVTRRSTQIACTYDVADGSWLAQFELDLQEGAFGREANQTEP